MLLIGTILFGDKSGAGVHWKFLPLLRDFGSIGQYSWGAACLAHLYRALCRASRFNCKEIDGPLTLLLCWAWIRLPYLSLLPRWRNWERGDRRYRYMKLAHFRKSFDELQEGQVPLFFPVCLGCLCCGRVDPNIIPPEIYMQSVVWSATVPLVSFECIEWHATDRFRRQFGFVQGLPSQERNLEKAHGETLKGPKNLNWATEPSHSKWVMHWSNRYNYILSELPMPSHHLLDNYMHWYRSKYGDHLNLSNLVGQDNDEGDQDMEEGDQDLDEDNQDTDEGSQDMDDDNQVEEPHSPHILPTNPIPEEQPQSSSHYVPQTQFPPSVPISQQYWGTSQFETGEGGSFSQLLGLMSADPGLSQYGHQPEFMAGRYSLDARYPGHTSSVASGGFVSVDSSRSDGGRGAFFSQNPNCVSMGLIEENANTLDRETDAYLVDDPDDEEDHDDDEIEDFDEDEESRNDGHASTLDETSKGYNLRIDPPRHSASRYTPSVFRKAAKKCKNLVKDVKWAMRK
ncbi:hypothetical protein Ahy_A09g044470 [Arachis hypogaea]|uniref:Aminotransferase-like plant mobile domain-containing protein n=1 Tax=Arachis hypogaea TaxID=3818 RepID=A0A445BK43_ARAHY|nr:hypothetical protein Ahy_A09g044470 [Arachis hypogaea]